MVINEISPEPRNSITSVQQIPDKSQYTDNDTRYRYFNIGKGKIYDQEQKQPVLVSVKLANISVNIG